MGGRYNRIHCETAKPDRQPSHSHSQPCSQSKRCGKNPEPSSHTAQAIAPKMPFFNWLSVLPGKAQLVSAYLSAGGFVPDRRSFSQQIRAPPAQPAWSWVCVKAQETTSGALPATVKRGGKDTRPEHERQARGHFYSDGGFLPPPSILNKCTLPFPGLAFLGHPQDGAIPGRRQATDMPAGYRIKSTVGPWPVGLGVPAGCWMK